VLELQADVTVEDIAGSTPLHVAAKNGHDDVISFLLTQPGIDPVSNLRFSYQYLYHLSIYIMDDHKAIELCRLSVAY